MSEASETFDDWAVLELMGHRRLGGRVREVTLAGGAFLRIDVPGNETPPFTQFYPPGSVYCLTPTTEESPRRSPSGPVTSRCRATSCRRPGPGASPIDVDPDDRPY